jgi:hypothetical protein
MSVATENQTEWISRSEARRRLACGWGVLDDLVKSGRISTRSVGVKGHTRFSAADVQRVLAEGTSSVSKD